MNPHRKKKAAARVAPPEQHDSPLLTLLLAEASRRGDTLATLATQLGVSYERLSQWRRGEASMRTSRQSVHRRAADYLGMAPVFVLALAGVVGIRDFMWPEAEPLEQRVRKELSDLLNDPFVGGFAPAELGSAAPEVKLFILWLYRELRASRGSERRTQRWLTEMQRAVLASERRTQHAPISMEQDRPSGLF